MAALNPYTREPVLALSEILDSFGVLVVAVLLGLLAVGTIFWLGRASRSARVVATMEGRALAPIVGNAQVSEGRLANWHRAHGQSVGRWIDNHERALEKFADENMAIDLTADLSGGHERLGPAIEEAITNHPDPAMRAELSGLVLASRSTIDALRRSNWTKAKNEHVVYLRLRDRWMARLQLPDVAHPELGNAPIVAPDGDDGRGAESTP